MPLLFVIALTPLSMILSDMKASYIHVLPGGNKINHLLYMDDLGKNKSEIESLTHTVRGFSSDVRMDFGIEKCAALSIKRGGRVESSGIHLPSGETIKSLEEDGAYKYLGVLEADNIKHNKIKKEIIKEYVACCHQILRSHLHVHACNKIDTINTVCSCSGQVLSRYCELDKRRSRQFG